MAGSMEGPKSWRKTYAKINSGIVLRITRYRSPNHRTLLEKNVLVARGKQIRAKQAVVTSPIRESSKVFQAPGIAREVSISRAHLHVSAKGNVRI